MKQISQNDVNNTNSDQRTRRDVVLAGLAALVAPNLAYSLQQDSPKKTEPRTITPLKAYEMFSQELNKQLNFWKDARVSHLEFDAKIADFDKKIADAQRYLRATGGRDDRPLKKAQQWRADAVSGKAAWEKEQLDPLKKDVEKASKKVIDFYSKMSTKARETVNDTIKKEIETATDKLKTAQTNSNKGVADKEVLVFLLTKHYSEIQNLQTTTAKK